MTKLDAGGKGGVLVALAEQLDVPVRFIGIGEQAADMDVFDAGEFAAALLGSAGPAAGTPDDPLRECQQTLRRRARGAVQRLHRGWRPANWPF
jgi:hypothetical protein